jgi:MFS family permease
MEPPTVSLPAPLRSGASARPVETAPALSVLRQGAFRSLWASQLATQVGANTVLYGLTVFLAGQGDGSGYASVSLLFLAFLLPAVLLSPLAGVWVDRLDGRRVLVAANLARTVAFLALILVGTNLWLIYGLCLFISSASTLFAPAEAAMIPRLVPTAALTGANSLFIFTLNAAFGIGFAVVGPLVLLAVGHIGLLLLVALLYGLAALACARLPGGTSAEPLPGPRAAALEAGAAVRSTLGRAWAELAEGWATIRARPAVAWPLAYLAAAFGLIGMLGVLGPGFARHSLGLSESSFAIIIAPLFLGLLLGIFGINQFGRYLPRRRLIDVGLLAMALLLGALALSGPLTRLLAAGAAKLPLADQVVPLISVLGLVIFIAVGAGMAYAAITVPAQTQLQEELPAEVRGRVFGVLNTLISAAALLPILLVGPLADLVGAEVVLLLAAIATAALGLASLRQGAPAVSVSAAPHGQPQAFDPLSLVEGQPTRPIQP